MGLNMTPEDERNEYFREDPLGFFRAHIVAVPVGLAFWAVVVVWAVYNALMLPTVYESYSTGYCVRVDDPRGVYSCENMPTKFHHVWQP